MFKRFLIAAYLIIVVFKINATNYYVNDASLTGDIYTGAIGSSTATGTSSLTPKNLLSGILTTYSLSFAAGDTIFIDAGNYTEIFLSSPQNGVVIKGAGASSSGYTKFTKSGSDRYFMLIDDNNTQLINMIIEGYDNSLAAAGKGMAVDIASGKTGIVFTNVVVRAIASSVGGVSWPIKINSSASVTFNGGGSVCNSTDGTTPGGGMLITGTACTVNINNYQFVNNYRKDIGANLNISGGNTTNLVNIYNTRFENGTSSGNRGVGIYINAGKLNVYNCIFKANTIQDGGGNFVGGTVCVEGASTVTISRSTFTANTGTGSGGVYGVGIGINSASAVVEIDSCRFGGNTAGGTHGNDIETKSGTVTVQKCLLQSVSKSINLTGGSCTVSNSGAPTGSTSVTMANTTATNYTANPTVLTYTGTCASTINLSFLPIELTRFEGDCNNGDVMLTWQTASEKNNQVFNVERSADGVQFEIIGSLKGAGTYEGYNNYTFIDNNKFDGLAYYRLSQQDYNGKVSQSKIISVEHLCGEHNDAEIFIYPNPSQNNAVINLKLIKKSSVSTLVYDGIGRLVASLPSKDFEVGLQNINIDANDFAPGIYFIKTSINDKEYVQKFVKL